MPYYRAAARLSPEDDRVQLGLANALNASGASVEAVRYYRETLLLNPDSAEAHNNLGMVLGSHGEIDEAIRHFQQALGIQADYADAHNNLGIALGARGQVREAVAHFQRALELRPDNSSARQNLEALLKLLGLIPQDIAIRAAAVYQQAAALGLASKVLPQATFAADADAFVDAFRVPVDVTERTRERTVVRLERQPVEDLRVDFEDGYGIRDDDEEDRHAEEAARAVLATRGDAIAPRWFGLRVKSFDDDRLEARSLRTLDRFVATLLAPGGGGLPDGFVVTFPKVTAPTQVERFAAALGAVESRYGLAPASLRFEVQVETPRSVLGPDGAAAAPRIVEAADGRLTAMHLGVFDYTASLGLMPWEQRLDHPANDFARQVLQVALAGTGVWVSDGSSNVVPRNDETPVVRAAWRTHADHVRHSLSNGFYQGWDLHPAHLASRYAAVYGWLLERFDGAIERVTAWREGAPARGVLDEPATIASLLRYLRFAVASGAVDESDVLSETGLPREELLGG